jgi:hypothetical protein
MLTAGAYVQASLALLEWWTDEPSRAKNNAFGDKRFLAS